LQIPASIARSPTPITLGAIFAIFAGWYYWFPKMTGYMYNERLGQLHFWLTFIGANVLFFPQHFLGLAGMPRRYADYPDAYAYWNWWSSIGSYITAVGTIVFIVGMLYDYWVARRRAGDNPWGPAATVCRKSANLSDRSNGDAVEGVISGRDVVAQRESE
jgi:cytochrome c oxidase subunit 1